MLKEKQSMQIKQIKNNNMHKLEKLILETYGQILAEMPVPRDDDDRTKKVNQLPKDFIKKIEDKYGPVNAEYDFFDRDLETYFKFTDKNKVTGSIAHKIIKLPSFDSLYTNFSDIIKDLKSLAKQEDIRKDAAARELFELIRTNYRKLQTYLRKERPEQYAMLRMRRGMLEAIDELKSRFPSEGLTIGGRRVIKIDKNDSNDPENFTIEFEDGTKEPYLHHLREDKQLNENLIDQLQEQEPEPEEPGDKEAPKETVLEDATDQILGKFPTLKNAIIKLQTEDFKEFIDSIDWISPRPTAFRINLKNGQDYILKWTGKSFQAEIQGKRYFIDKIDDYQQALDRLAILYKEGPMKGAGDGEAADLPDTGGGGGGGDFPGADTGGGGGDAVDDLGGGEEPGGADLTGEPVDFEEPGEEPEA